jgi:SAM-dependent methyltransferase
MKLKDYYKVQVSSSTWTRESKLAQDLVVDSVDFFHELIPKTEGVILELGCGDGFSLDVLRQYYPVVLGCDINFNKLEIAARNENTVCLQDLHFLGFKDNAIDAVYCTHTLEHTHNGYQAVREIFRILVPGGTALLIVPDHFALYGETFVTEDQVIPLENRPEKFFEEKALERKGVSSQFPRNQFPFSMKLFLNVIQSAGFEIQLVQRIMRNGPELWCFVTKPKQDMLEGIEPLIHRGIERKSTQWQGITQAIQKIVNTTLKK